VQIPNAEGIIDPGAFFQGKIDEEKAKGKKANTDMIKAWESIVATMKPSQVTALQQTVQQTNCVPCLELLLKHGADINKTDVDGGLIHTLASFSMDKDMRKDGFAKGDPGMASLGLKVPDFYANLLDEIHGTPAQMLDLLIKAGADVNAKHADGVSALMVVLRLHKLDLAKTIVNNGTNVVSESAFELGKITRRLKPNATSYRPHLILFSIPIRT